MSLLPPKTLLAALLFSSCLVPAAQAATITWDGGASTSNWGDAANWSGDAVPTSADDVRLNTSGITVSAFDATSATLNVGHSSSGSLTVSNGGSASSANGYSVYVGTSSGGTGAITVTGAGSTLETGAVLSVGQAGNGTLTVADGGLVVSATGYKIQAANLVGSTGTIIVTGSGSTLESGGIVYIGNYGNGSLAIENGGDVVSGAGYNILAGYYSGSTGTITVTGSGSTLESGSEIHIGESGTGSLTISDGGVVRTAAGSSINVGANTGSSGTMTISGVGSVAISGSYVFIGNHGSGSLTVLDGGFISSSAGYGISLGRYEDGSGSISVIGAGSTITSGSAFHVGLRGTGVLVVSNGGLVTSADGYDINAGNNAGSTGNITVTGAGSALESGAVVYVGNSGTGTLTVSDSGRVAASGLLSIANVSGSTGTLNIGAAHGSTAAAPGTVTAFSVVFGAGTGTIVFNHTSSDYVFDLDISGTGTIENDAGTTTLTRDLSGFMGTYDVEGGILNIAYAGSGSQTISNSLSGSGTYSFTSGKTILTGDSSGFTGSTNVTGAGTLAVNGTLGGTVNVASGGRLQGAGTVGAIVAASGGTVAPGNSINTLSVSGNVSFAPGSVLEEEVTASASDKIEATGTATLTGGTVSVVNYEGATLTAGTRYTILSASGGVSGAFDGASFATSRLFLTPALSKDATNVYLTITRNDTSFASVAAGANQQAVAGAAESLGAGTAVYDAIAMQSTAPEAQSAYAQLSGEIHPNIKASLLEGQSALTQTLSNRLATADLPAKAGQIGQTAALVPAFEPSREDVLLYGKKIAKESAQELTNLGPQAWVQGFGNWSSRKGDANASRFKETNQGGMIGADAAVGAGWRSGFALGYRHSDYDQDKETNANGKAESYSLSVYGGKNFANKLAVRTGVSYGYSEIETRRSLAFPFYTDALKATYHAHSLQGFGEVAYRFDHQATRLEPFWNMAVGYVSVPGFTEKGGAAALHGNASEETQGVSTLGLRVRQNLPFFGPDNKRDYAALSGLVGWQRRIGDRAPGTSLSFAQGGRSFTEDPAKLAQDALAVGLGLDVAVGEQTTLGVNYSGAYSSKADAQSVQGSLSYRF